MTYIGHLVDYCGAVHSEKTECNALPNEKTSCQAYSQKEYVESVGCSSATSCSFVRLQSLEQDTCRLPYGMQCIAFT